MGIGKDLSTNIKEWGILVMVIVVISVVLLKFRVNDSIVCSSGVLNETGSVNICCTGTANATASACQVANESVRTLYTDLNTYVSAFS